MERVTPERGPYTQKDVLPLLRVKPHVLRYWEQTLPLVRSGRDDAGRRVWTAGQVRMLLRVRHLVVDKGVSVPAAGEALLREAGEESARVKAGLERVRNSLVVLLLKVQVRSRGGKRYGEEPGGHSHEASITEQDSHAADDLVLHLRSLVDQNIIDAPNESIPPPFPVIRLWNRGPRYGESDTRESVEADARGGSLRLVYSHLFARDDPAIIARTLAAIIHHRLSREAPGEERGPLVIAAPRGEEHHYREAFPSETMILSVPDAVYGTGPYRAPTLSIMTAIASNRDLDRYARDRGREILYIWAADSIYSPVHNPLGEAALESSCGIALGIRRVPEGYRLAESVAINLSAWRPRFVETMRCGRWIRSNHGPRYLLWLRDLARLEPPGVLLPERPGPGVWRGREWRDQVRLIWPDIEL